MRRSFSAIMAGVALAALAYGPALAADLPSQSAAPYYIPPPLFTWAGFYAGATAGLNFGQFTDGGRAYFNNAFGGLYGIEAGYNYQSGSLVAGVEANLDFGSIYGSAAPFPNVWSSGHVTGDGSLRVRFGYALDRALIYVTGGYAGATMTGSLNDASAVPSVLASQSTYLNGFTIGGGLEFAVTNRVSIKAEYLFNDFGGAGLFAGTRDTLSSGVEYSTFRAGVNYHF